jgi:hypothetical protein
MRALNLMMRAWEAENLPVGWYDVSHPDEEMPTDFAFDEAIGANLAVRLRSRYGSTLDGDVVQMATDGKALVAAMVAASDFSRVSYPDLPDSDRCVVWRWSSGWAERPMSRWTDAPIVGGAYSDDTRPFSVQDTVNFIPVYAEKAGTRSPSMLRCAPGYLQFCDLKTDAPLRGTHNAEGVLLAVSGNTLYQVNPSGSARTIGVIPGVGRVIMAHNQITGGNEVAIANGSSGYIYNTVDKHACADHRRRIPGREELRLSRQLYHGIEPGGRFRILVRPCRCGIVQHA